MDIGVVSSLAAQGLAAVFAIAWGVRLVTRQRSYRETCRIRLRETAA